MQFFLFPCLGKLVIRDRHTDPEKRETSDRLEKTSGPTENKDFIFIFNIYIS